MKPRYHRPLPLAGFVSQKPQVNLCACFLQVMIVIKSCCLFDDHLLKIGYKLLTFITMLVAS